MVPVSLTVKNFLSYGEQVPPLDFEPLHVVCLSGDNGHGKSALLDAITWAVWGEARKASSDRKPDERLLRIGATEMAVEFVFDLEGARYRLLRQYRKSGRGGKSNLEFQVYSDESEGFNSLTQTSLNATQQKIIETLRMDYTTFINSVFILQGRADEFTKLGARDRKKILADILGLSRYEALEQRARDRAQQAAKEHDDCEKRLHQIDEELQQRDTCTETIEALNRTIEDLSSRMTAADHELDALREQRAELAGAARQLTDMRRHREQIETELDDLRANIHAQRPVVAEYQAALAEKEEIERAYQDYQALLLERDTYAQKERKLNHLNQRRAQVERIVEEARHEMEKLRRGLEAQRESFEQTIAEMEEILKQQAMIDKGYADLQRGRLADEQWEEKRRQHDESEQPIRAREKELLQAQKTLESELGGYQLRLKDLKAKAARLPGYEERVRESRQRLEHLMISKQKKEEITEKGVGINGQIETLKKQIKFYEREEEDINYKRTVLNRDEQAHCPLCEAVLDLHRRRAIEANLGAQLKQHAEEVERLNQKIRLYQDERTTLARQYREINAEVESIAAVQQALADAEAAAREAKTAAQEMVTLQRQIEALKDRLANQQFTPEVQQALAELQDRQKAVGYEATRHQAVKAKLRDLHQFEASKARLDDARVRHGTAMASLPAIQERIRQLDQQLQERAYAPDQQAQLNALMAEIQDLDYDQARHDHVEKTLNRSKEVIERKEKLDQAMHQFAAARQTLISLETRAREAEEQRTLDAEQIERLQTQTLQIKPIEQQIQTLAAQRADLSARRDKAMQQRGAAQRQAEEYEKLATERPEVERRRQAAARDAQVYEKLTTAFGKDGIQALIIENALPEIEEEANRILSRLTGNRTHITIEPLRDLKTGGTKETLDINISDELGIRPYELFSGGEAFRTNFALRIALSKLLVHRAGTRLRTLVIDEGFGTQDTQGLEYMIEAIQDIQDDFDKIVVVTHLERLKNVFPARIEVTKYADVGSRYEVFM